MKKRIIVMLLGLSMLMSFTGCTKTKKEDAYHVGIVQVMEHPSLNTIRESIEQSLKEQNFDKKVVIDYKNAQGDQTNLNSICQKFIGDKKDVIVAIATPSAQSAAAATKEIPIVFSAVTDPVAAKLVLNREKPEGNITGTSDAIPVEELFALAKVLTPEAKTFGFIYNTGEVNSLSVIAQAKKYCDNHGLSYIEAVVTNSNEVQQATQSLIGKVDAIFTPIDNTVASAMPVLADVANSAKIPVYTGADSLVADGGFATVGIEYITLGKRTAMMVANILNGKPVEEIPVEVLNNFGIVINKSTAEQLGIVIPKEILEKAQIIE